MLSQVNILTLILEIIIKILNLKLVISEYIKTEEHFCKRLHTKFVRRSFFYQKSSKGKFNRQAQW